jgi:cytochrome c-type biogenesis protein CcmE
MAGVTPSVSPVGRATALKIVASVVLVAGAVAFLLTKSMKQGAEYYKHVDEVTSNLEHLRGMRLQVHGNVVDGSIEQRKGTLQYRFKIESRAPRAPAILTATYDGLVPDTFKDSAEVVAKGTLTADNQLAVVPDGIMAKCPSKYDADKADQDKAAKDRAGKPGALPDIAQKI